MYPTYHCNYLIFVYISEEVDVCKEMNCNNGICRKRFGQASCKCDPGFTGELCNIGILAFVNSVKLLYPLILQCGVWITSFIFCFINISTLPIHKTCVKRNPLLP